MIMRPIPAGIIGGAAAAGITVLQDFTDTGATSVANPGSFTVNSGSNRMLVLVQYSAGTPAQEITAITWGGRSMTRRVRVDGAGGFPVNAAIWTLPESEIALAVGTAFVYTGTTSGDDKAHALVLGGPDQSNPIVDTGTGIQSGGNPADVTVTTVNNGIAIAACSFDNTSSETIEWASPFDTGESGLITTGVVPGGNSFRAARTFTTGVNVTSDVETGDSSFQQSQCVASFRPA